MLTPISRNSVGAVNFPEVDLRVITEADSRVIRICYVHHNQVSLDGAFASEKV